MTTAEQQLYEWLNIKSTDTLSVIQIMNVMDNIQYGYVSKKTGKKLTHIDEHEFYNEYYLQTPVECVQNRIGVCWDQTEVERSLFKLTKYDTVTVYIELASRSSHTFLLYKQGTNWLWFEHSYGKLRGLKKGPFKSIEHAAYAVANLMTEDSDTPNDKFRLATTYEMATTTHLGCQDFMDHCRNGRRLTITNATLFDANLYIYVSPANMPTIKKYGLMSIYAMHTLGFTELFKQNVEKYLHRFDQSFDLIDVVDDPTTFFDMYQKHKGKNAHKGIFFLFEQIPNGYSKERDAFAKSKQLITYPISALDRRWVYYGVELPQAKRSHSWIPMTLTQVESYKRNLPPGYFEKRVSRPDLIFQEVPHVAVCPPTGILHLPS